MHPARHQDRRRLPLRGSLGRVSPEGRRELRDRGARPPGARLPRHRGDRARGQGGPRAVRRAQRALAEFRIRGVSTNIGFLRGVLADTDFLAGRATTSFIDEHPELLRPHESADRATKLLQFLAERTINKPWPGHGAGRLGREQRRRRRSGQPGEPGRGARAVLGRGHADRRGG
ncbi:hypothetical protein [Propioniciclava sp. MC1595]|uniref:hypothetical protein n=1 Tax=Propioniciclava sp. MC1595 TaxID=2760308 RepID=UPI0035CD2207